jgi:TRAP-type uncharacterized transport system fused permease subunit
MLAWKYTVPAFVVPLAFTMSARGTAVLLLGSAGDVLLVSLMAAVGVAAIAAGTGGYIRRAATPLERTLAVAGGALLLSADFRFGAAGAGMAALAVALNARSRS